VALIAGRLSAMKSKIALLLLLASGALAAAVLSITAALLFIHAEGTPGATAVTTGSAAIGGPFTLVNTKGETVTDQTYRGKWLLIFFGYTFCPDACPTALNNMSVALEKLGSDAEKLQSVFVTVDPQRDTREAIAKYLESFDPRIVGLTGTQYQIDDIVREYRVFVEKDAAGGPDYLVTHSAFNYLMNPQGKFVNIVESNAPGEDIAAWLRKQMAGSKTERATK
jgi:protein SCO1